MNSVQITWGLVYSLLGSVAGIALTLGMLKSSVSSMKQEIKQIRDIVPEFAALKVAVADAIFEINHLRDTMTEMRHSLTEVKVQVATKSRKRK